MAPFFLPRAWRDDLMAVYGFARLVDDIGDGDLAPGGADARHLGLAPEAAEDRLAFLDAFEADLHRVFDGTPATPSSGASGRPCCAAGSPRALPRPDRRQPAGPAGRALRDLRRPPRVLRALRQPRRPARPRDHRHRHPRADPPLRRDLHRPPDRRAPPGRRRGPRQRPDLPPRRGPQALPRHGERPRPAHRRRLRTRPDRLRGGPGPRTAPRGHPLVGSVHGRLRLLLAGFTAGGLAALDAITDAGFDVLTGPPKATKPSLMRQVGAVLLRARREG